MAGYTCFILLLLTLIGGTAFAEVCTNVAHPVDSALTMASCTLQDIAHLADIPDVRAIELKFKQLNSIDFDQFSVARPSLSYLVFDMTFLSFSAVKRAMNGLTAPALQTLTVKRDLNRDGDSLYLDARTFGNLPMLQTLNLKGIGIGVLHEETFRGLFALSVLDLGTNYIEEFPEYSLQDCRNLTIVRLQENFIKPQNLLEHSFSGPTALHWLNLENNKLSYVPANRFVHLGSLAILVLTRNDIEFVEPDAFLGLTDMHFLALSNNKLQRVPREALDNIPNLYSLDLSLNELDELQDGSFESLSNLEVLYLQYTNLGGVDVSGESFRGLKKLRELHLKSNQIQSVNATTFAHLPNVVHVDLSDNKLTELGADTFAFTRNLQVLKLSGNELRYLERGVFDAIPLLGKLYLDDNRWNCSCDLLWLFQWINDNEEKLTNEHELYVIECSTPLRYQHQTFYDLRLSFVMGCQEELTQPDITTEAQLQDEDQPLSSNQLAGLIVAVVIGLIVVVFIVVAVLFVRRRRTHRIWKPGQESSQSHDVPDAAAASDEREQRQARHRTPSWCKDPAPAEPPRVAATATATATTTPTTAPPGYAYGTPEQQENKANEVFAFDNMALETSMLSQNGVSPTKSNGSGGAASPRRIDYGQPTSTSSPRDHTVASPDVHVHSQVDINKNKNGL